MSFAYGPLTKGRFYVSNVPAEPSVRPPVDILLWRPRASEHLFTYAWPVTPLPYAVTLPSSIMHFAGHSIRFSNFLQGEAWGRILGEYQKKYGRVLMDVS